MPYTYTKLFNRGEAVAYFSVGIVDANVDGKPRIREINLAPAKDVLGWLYSSVYPKKYLFKKTLGEKIKNFFSR